METERLSIPIKSNYDCASFHLPSDDLPAEISGFLGNHFDFMMYCVKKLSDYQYLEKLCEENKLYFREQFSIFKINDERLPTWMLRDFPDLVAEIPDEYADYKDPDDWYTIGMKYTDSYSFEPDHEWSSMLSHKDELNDQNANVTGMASTT